ncbi:sigma-70 family RNA polymerase sigma factor [Prosthecobacter sp.]|jgi:RNA polymerase sigma-70 factor (ECF subfamily)|uniref:RNA polymerase sigma factor n=1 Tax=Prosthecobacter sp. TaxID=1965333 RepID=UPI0025F0FD46|nr:sigma-70 family RNA polymerase sigma factor [Prosthecobacter sp.]
MNLAVDTNPVPSLLERLFAESAEELKRFFARRHGGEEAARDLVQETFLQMARGLRDGKSPKCARGYLFGIARHVSHAVWREKDADKVLPFDPDTNETPAPERDERVEAARETISALEPVQREILDLRFAQGLSYAEIAEALSIPIGTVRSRLHHAVAEVRQRLESENH